jgi:hypothetical protein
VVFIALAKRNLGGVLGNRGWRTPMSYGRTQAGSLSHPRHPFPSPRTPGKLQQDQDDQQQQQLQLDEQNEVQSELDSEQQAQEQNDEAQQQFDEDEQQTEQYEIDAGQ